jgi:hypothetical protein
LARSQAPQHLETIEIWQANVEHDEIKLLVREQSIRLLAGRCASDCVAGASQYFDEPVCEERVIFNDENAHDVTSGVRRPSEGGKGIRMVRFRPFGKLTVPRRLPSEWLGLCCPLERIGSRAGFR